MISFPVRQTVLLAATLTLVTGPARAQEAKRRWERLCQIRQEKFDRILPEVMRENGIDMWIVAQKEGHNDPMYEHLGRGYTGSIGYYLFADRGEGRVERAALGITGGMLEQCPSYDLVSGDADLAKFVAERAPQRIGINTSDEIGAADGLSHSLFLHLRKTLGSRYADRMVSAEKLVSDYRSRHTAAELVAFGEAGELSRTIAERALSNEVIVPGRTTLSDVAWWMWDQLLAKGLGSSFDMPSVYITGPDGIEATSNERIIQRGDLLVIDWGVGYLNMWTDVKRMAYVLREGERAVPPGFQRAFDQAAKVREVIRRTIRPGGTAAEMLATINRAIAAMPGFEIMPGFNRPSADPATTDVIVGCHAVGDLGHGSGPSIAWFNPLRLTFAIRPTNLFSIEFFAYTSAPEFGGKKVRIPLEDNAVVTERGVEWLYPINPGIRLIK
ncbi:MAG: M24 family metallopeptidase [Gemmatimonadetes bacterium]|nr:M24 family metallopeptidase [Gemmatimonadota bacterium]